MGQLTTGRFFEPFRFDHQDFPSRLRCIALPSIALHFHFHLHLFTVSLSPFLSSCLRLEYCIRVPLDWVFTLFRLLVMLFLIASRLLSSTRWQLILDQWNTLIRLSCVIPVWEAHSSVGWFARSLSPSLALSLSLSLSLALSPSLCLCLCLSPSPCLYVATYQLLEGAESSTQFEFICFDWSYEYESLELDDPVAHSLRLAYVLWA